MGSPSHAMPFSSQKQLSTQGNSKPSASLSRLVGFRSRGLLLLPTTPADIISGSQHIISDPALNVAISPSTIMLEAANHD